MAIAKTILFLDDRLHSSVATSDIAAASSTAQGSRHNVRDANFLTYWKPNDSPGTDEIIRADFGDTAQLGAAAATAYMCLAYDPRSIDQSKIWLQYDTADSSTFSSPVSHGSFAIPTTHLYPTCQWISFTVPTPAKRHWRLVQTSADRGGGTRTIRLYYWAAFAISGVLNLDTDFEKPGPAPGRYGQTGLTGLAATPAGISTSNAFGAPVQSFDIGVSSASAALWEQVRNALATADVNGRAFFVQYEGLRNEALSNFYLCRSGSPSFDATRRPIERFDFSIPFVTEASI